MNAYVSGLGASKRIVVWDTTVDKEDHAGKSSSVLGHEMGHYVLGTRVEGADLHAGGAFPCCSI